MRPVLALLVLVAACQPMPPPPAAPEPAPAEPAVVEAPAPDESPLDPRACTDSSECEVYCPDVEGCCGWSCGCKNAINRDYRDVFIEQHAQSCERVPDCQPVGCAYKPAMSAACVDGQCRPTDGPF